MTNTFKVWDSGTHRDITIGQGVLVFHIGQGRNYSGEFGTLVRATKQHLVFQTQSGTIVKTKKDNLQEVVGKAKKLGISITLKTEGREQDSNFTLSHIII